MSLRVRDLRFPLRSAGAANSRPSLPKAELPAGGWYPARPGEPAVWLLQGLTKDGEVLKTF